MAVIKVVVVGQTVRGVGADLQRPRRTQQRSHPLLDRSLSCLPSTHSPSPPWLVLASQRTFPLREGGVEAAEDSLV
jgi:hypothetical protein